MGKDWAYSKHTHMVKSHGGPEPFLRDYASANYQLGVEAEKRTEGWKGAILFTATIAFWELCRFWCNSVETKRALRKADLLRKSETAEKQYRDYIQTSKIDTDTTITPISALDESYILE